MQDILAPKTTPYKMPLGYRFSTPQITRFHNSILIQGSIESKDTLIEKVWIESNNIHSQFNLHSSDKPSKNQKFFIQALFTKRPLMNEIKLFLKAGDFTLSRKLSSFVNERVPHPKLTKLYHNFKESIPKNGSIIDIGGRDRSGVDHSQFFPNTKVTVFDILEGKNVDVVGDAHKLSEYFPKSTFDGVYCVAVFEHILMPWKVALEMNKVMKEGATALILTHQSIGLHEAPWDFWRFSDNAWAAIFNKKTGFEIIETTLEEPNYILPHYHRNNIEHAELETGYRSTSVFIRKISESTLNWNISLEEITDTMYPPNPR